MFIHGGYWRSMDKSDFSFIALPFVEEDLNVALVNYPLSPDGRTALAWLVCRGSSCGDDGQHRVDD